MHKSLEKPKYTYKPSKEKVKEVKQQTTKNNEPIVQKAKTKEKSVDTEQYIADLKKKYRGPLNDVELEGTRLSVIGIVTSAFLAKTGLGGIVKACGSPIAKVVPLNPYLLGISVLLGAASIGYLVWKHLL
ncbi:MAG: hypothetical protein OEY06_12155 [Gammaproteobacteria bacterium]|nr:hypothetical protein [Gammaproteobacteria bacterium]